MDDGIKIKSLYKALKILECFTVQKPELGVTEISEMLGLYKSNVHNIISTFEKAGFIEKNLENGKYRLGLKILELAHVISTNMSFRSIILPYMQQIANQANEIVYLAIPHEGQVLYLDAAFPQNSLPTRSMLGETAPMYCTGIGKAMLAYLPLETIEIIISGGLQKFTENTVISKDELLAELGRIKERGYAIDNMEHEYGIKCVGMPIRDQRGRVLAGLSISGPSLRFDDEKIEYFAQLLRENITLIQKRL